LCFLHLIDTIILLIETYCSLNIDFKNTLLFINLIPIITYKSLIMKNQFSLRINKPCLENYNLFKPTLNGGFCGSCQKEVIDFSKMNPQEIMRFFKNNQAVDICGKFNSNQLKNETDNSNSRKRYSFWSGIGLACLSIFSFNTSQAQTEVTQKASEKTIKNQDKKITVKGFVFDDLGPISDINILLQGTTIRTATDFDGYFEFPKSLKNGDVLVFSQIGMKSQKIVINNSNPSLNVELKVNMKSDTCILMGRVAVKQVYKSKRKN